MSSRCKRRRGATLGFVACLLLVIALLGIGFYFLCKILGGGRELQHGTDAANLNVAKNAIKIPSKPAVSFANPDVQTNFQVYGEKPDLKLNLLNYNRCVGHALIVALNAKEMQTDSSQMNAKKCWIALNDVGKFLRGSLEQQMTLESQFANIADSNNFKMLGNKSRMTQSDYDISFMRRGGPTNIVVDKLMLNTFNTPPILPLAQGGISSPKYPGKYLSGFQNIEIPLTHMGYDLFFAGVPTCPQDRPHMVAHTDFMNDKSDNFISGKGTPSYPAGALPPNSFKSGGAAKEERTKQFVNAISCAIVSSMSADYPWRLDYGYIEIRNFSAAASPASGQARSDQDIFCHELYADGIRTDGNLFTRNGSNWNSWFNYNNAPPPLPPPNPLPPGYVPPTPPPQPSVDGIFKADGTPASAADASKIRAYWDDQMTICRWSDYGSSPKQTCVDMLPAFKIAYNRPGTIDDTAAADSGWTNLEQFKANVMSPRYPIVTCATINAPQGRSGVKWFDHKKSHRAPADGPYNFGVFKSPYEYLEMIAQVSGDCPIEAVFKDLHRKARQIKPDMGEPEFKALLRSKPLPLGRALFIYKVGDDLVMDESRPPGFQPNAVADGSVMNQCGKEYDVIGSLVCTTSGWNPSGGTGDGLMYQPYGERPDGACKDNPVWAPSSGFNNFLGLLEFENTCTGGGRFCKPN